MSPQRIDLTADLNQEEARGYGFAHLDELRPGVDVTAGTVLVAGRECAWSWVRVAEVTGGWIYFTPLTGSPMSTPQALATRAVAAAQVAQMAGASTSLKGATVPRAT